MTKHHGVAFALAAVALLIYAVQASAIPLLTNAPATNVEPLEHSGSAVLPSDVPAAQPRAARPEPPMMAFEGPPSGLMEGKIAKVAWTTQEPIRSIAVSLWSCGAAQGKEQVGTGEVVVAPSQPASAGSVEFTVPALDAIRVYLMLTGYDDQGRPRQTASLELPYRPKAMATEREDGLYVWLSRKGGQRLIWQRDGRLLFYAVCSGARGGLVLPITRDVAGPHDHYGTFKVETKTGFHRSELNEDWIMQYVLFYHKGHSIHSTTPNYYGDLGRGSSMGCIRLHFDQARQLFEEIMPGEMVKVF